MTHEMPYQEVPGKLRFGQRFSTHACVLRMVNRGCRCVSRCSIIGMCHLQHVYRFLKNLTADFLRGGPDDVDILHCMQ